MTDPAKLRTRGATSADAAAIAAIYNEGIADRIATFETELRSAADIAGWFTEGPLVVVVETGETGVDLRSKEIGIHRQHGQFDGVWRDCVIVERLLGKGASE